MTSAVNRLRLSEVINNWIRQGRRLPELREPVFRSLPVAPCPPFLLFCSVILFWMWVEGVRVTLSWSPRVSPSLFVPPLRITETSGFDTSLGTICMKFDSSKNHLEVPAVWTIWRTFFCVLSLLDRRSRI